MSEVKSSKEAIGSDPVVGGATDVVNDINSSSVTIPINSAPDFTPTVPVAQDLTTNNESEEEDLHDDIMEVSQLKARKNQANTLTRTGRKTVDSQGLTALTDDQLDQTLNGEELEKIRKERKKKQTEESKELLKRFFPSKLTNEEWTMVEHKTRLGDDQEHLALSLTIGAKKQVAKDFKKVAVGKQNRAIDRVISMINMNDETRQKMMKSAAPVSNWFWIVSPLLLTKEKMNELLKKTKSDRKEEILQMFEKSLTEEYMQSMNERERKDLQAVTERVKKQLASQGERAILGMVFEIMVLSVIEHQLRPYSIFNNATARGYVENREEGVPLAFEPRVWVATKDVPEKTGEEKEQKLERKGSQDYQLQAQCLKQELKLEKEKVKTMMEDEKRKFKEEIEKSNQEKENLKKENRKLKEDNQTLQKELKKAGEKSKEGKANSPAEDSKHNRQQQTTTGGEDEKQREYVKSLEKKVETLEKQLKEQAKDLTGSDSDSDDDDRPLVRPKVTAPELKVADQSTIKRTDDKKKEEKERKEKEEKARKDKEEKARKEKEEKERKEKEEKERREKEEKDRQTRDRRPPANDGDDSFTVVLKVRGHGPEKIENGRIEQALVNFLKIKKEEIKVSPLGRYPTNRAFRIDLRNPTSRTKRTVYEFNRVRTEAKTVGVWIERYRERNRSRPAVEENERVPRRYYEEQSEERRLHQSQTNLVRQQQYPPWLMPYLPNPYQQYLQQQQHLFYMQQMQYHQQQIQQRQQNDAYHNQGHQGRSDTHENYNGNNQPRNN
jgi:hypothetical protein